MSQAWLDQITDFARNSRWLVKKFGGYCDNPYDIQRHHVEGRKAKRKINGVAKVIGGYYVFVVPTELHDVHSNNSLNVTHCKRKFEEMFGTQKEIYLDMVDSMIDYGYVPLVPSEVIHVI